MRRPTLLAVAGVIILGIAIGMSWWNKQRDEATVPGSQPAEQSAAPKPDEKAAGTPSFDVVRINPQGETVIAGRAAPHAEVTIMDGDREIGRVTADNHGEWVFVPDKPLPPGSRELTLNATNPDGTTGKTEAPVVLVVPDRNGDKEGSLAVKVNPDGSIEVLQGPGAQVGIGSVAITGVRFDPNGHLSVSGNASPNASVQLYLDNRPLARTQANGEGHWNVTPRPVVTAGTHSIRADELGGDGKVVARAEISFALPSALPTAATGEKVTVEPGNSLWRIARKTYGTGFDYLTIYKANKEQIRDPNLIYPGQIFILPKSN